MDVFGLKLEILLIFNLIRSPSSLICRFHNVKQVSLEEGVPPPFRFDVPIVRSALENPDALFPTHVLAVYDQDTTPEPSPPLSPHGAAFSFGTKSPLVSSSSFFSGPGAPLMIPVNASLWARAFNIQLSNDAVPSSPDPSPTLPAIRYSRTHIRDESFASISTSTCSSRPGSCSSLASLRPRSVLSLPVHVLRVPSASSLPLLLLACLRIVSYNLIAPALLPRIVLSELPAPSAILTEHMLRFLYSKGENRKSNVVPRSERSPLLSIPSPASSKLDSDAEESRNVSPLLMPSVPDDVDTRRFSQISESSVSSLSLPSPTLPTGHIPARNSLEHTQNSNRNSYSGPSPTLIRPDSPPPRPRSAAGLSPSSPYAPYASPKSYVSHKQLNIPISPSPLSPFHAVSRQQSANEHFLSTLESLSRENNSSTATPRRKKRQSIYSEIHPSVLSDPFVSSDPDIRLLALAQQNFGMWANALSLGARDPEIVGLVDIAWTVVRETRRIRFGVGSSGKTSHPAARRKSPIGPRSAEPTMLNRLRNKSREQDRT